ncbi:hypothetical protein AQUCO_04700035v1 [Aquilegia coerulea]|uniref:Uncharacterized protein n=1 Tax=Aquilegia coerulea TaxID=218851 RepID=A0A2G5CKP4_AQUCA|nr:hypothetical protein AQUCO_04700035v1 [Aquilegia coerulea]
MNNNVFLFLGLCYRFCACGSVGTWGNRLLQKLINNRVCCSLAKKDLLSKLGFAVFAEGTFSLVDLF